MCGSQRTGYVQQTPPLPLSQRRLSRSLQGRAPRESAAGHGASLKKRSTGESIWAEKLPKPDGNGDIVIAPHARVA